MQDAYTDPTTLYYDSHRVWKLAKNRLQWANKTCEDVLPLHPTAEDKNRAVILRRNPRPIQQPPRLNLFAKFSDSIGVICNMTIKGGL